jgi:hypothetical protein
MILHILNHLFFYDKILDKNKMLCQFIEFSDKI